MGVSCREREAGRGGGGGGRAQWEAERSQYQLLVLSTQMYMFERAPDEIGLRKYVCAAALEKQD